MMVDASSGREKSNSEGRNAGATKRMSSPLYEAIKAYLDGIEKYPPNMATRITPEISTLATDAIRRDSSTLEAVVSNVMHKAISAKMDFLMRASTFYF